MTLVDSPPSCEGTKPWENTKPKRGLYLCLQATREGQASYAHVNEIVNGLRDLGWSIELFEPIYAAPVSLLHRLWAFIVVQLQLLRKLSSADVLYIRGHIGTFPTALCARLLRIPVVQEVNGPFLDYYVAYPSLKSFAWIVNYFSRLNLKLADAVIVVTPQLGEWVIQEIGPKPVHVIPNAANAEIFHPQAKTTYSLPQQRVVFFGAMAPWHGVQDMLDAALHEDWPSSVSLVLAGEGTDSPAIEKMAERCPHIIYLGKIPYGEVPGVVAGSLAGLVVITDPAGRSATGLFPIKLFETVACGVPVIVTEFPGQADFVRKYNCGLVVPPENPAALAAAVNYLAQDESEQSIMGHRGRSAIEKSHSWTCRASDTSAILSDLASRTAV